MYCALQQVAILTRFEIYILELRPQWNIHSYTNMKGVPLYNTHEILILNLKFITEQGFPISCRPQNSMTSLKYNTTTLFHTTLRKYSNKHNLHHVSNYKPPYPPHRTIVRKSEGSEKKLGMDQRHQSLFVAEIVQSQSPHIVSRLYQ
jgi:hypothetical protein